MKQIIKSPKILKNHREMKTVKNKEREEFEEELIRHLLRTEADIENGRTRDFDEVFKEWEEKYGI